jgi:tripartite-type tricarboxylate transporter receptor subunit TctC
LRAQRLWFHERRFVKIFLQEIVAGASSSVYTDDLRRRAAAGADVAAPGASHVHPETFVRSILTRRRLLAITVLPLPLAAAAFLDETTLAEFGMKDFEAYAWQGLVVPAAAPPAALAMPSMAFGAALGSAAVDARFQTLGLEAPSGTPAPMAAYAKTERDKWRQVIRASNIRLG